MVKLLKKIDSSVTLINKKFDNLQEKVQNHEHRICQLESDNRYAFPGHTVLAEGAKQTGIKLD